jgi:hypothetical protein
MWGMLMETIYWSDALADMPRHIRLRGVSPKMLTPEGEVVEVLDDGKTHKVLFDKKFVFWVVTERFLKPLGLIGKEDYLRDTLFPELIEYVTTEGTISQERQLHVLAKQMSRYNGRTLEENLKLLRGSSTVVDTDYDDDYNYYEPNGKEESLVTTGTGKKKTA